MDTGDARPPEWTPATHDRASSTKPTSTTTVLPTTTSTTLSLPPVCGVDPSFPWIVCRVDALLLVVEEASELGPYQDDFLANLQRTQSFVTDGMKDCDAGQTAPARRSLDRVERQMLALRARVRRGRARRTIPRPLATRIADDARAIANDARSLRGVLTCP